jgi:ABC-type transporter Mla maintaining outer membrane lipid asymmetry permease subunit MlaE
MIALILSALSAMFGIFGGISISTYLAGLRP